MSRGKGEEKEDVASQPRIPPSSPRLTVNRLIYRHPDSPDESRSDPKSQNRRKHDPPASRPKLEALGEVESFPSEEDVRDRHEEDA